MPDRVGQQLRNYRLVKLLGQGGFAEVYLGQHVLLASKQAAIKILHMFNIDVQAFQKEAETTEQLAHPHIVRLLEYDLLEGMPFLILDYAPGGSLRNRHPKGSSVPLDMVTGYLKEIAPALQYAHNKHILHRDIKPENVLIGRQGELLLSDFGIAVLAQTGRTSLSSAYDIGGTPYYMAPETFHGKPEKASDQYSLAVVVYEWLCGSVPFAEGNFIQLGFQHASATVLPLRKKNPALAIAPEVEAVLLKALAKDPKDRFASVQTFTQAFEQACRPTFPPEPPPLEPPGEPTTSVPPPEGSSSPGTSTSTTLVVPTRRITRRTLLVLGLAGAGVAVTGIGIGVWWSFTHINSPLYTYTGDLYEVNSVAWSPDGKSIASGSDSSTEVWDATTGNRKLTYTGHSDKVFSVAWSPDGKEIASASRDRTVQVWDATTGNNKLTYKGHADEVFSAAWSPDGKEIASGSFDHTVQVWDAVTGDRKLTYTGHSDKVDSVAWSPDGKEITSGSDDYTVQIWDTATGTVRVTYRKHSDFVHSVVWSPDGKEIASASRDRTVQVWDSATGNHKLTYKGHADEVYSVAWSPDGKEIASGSLDYTMQVWDAATGNWKVTYTAPSGAVTSVVWSPDGKEIASTSYRDSVQVWQAR